MKKYAALLAQTLFLGLLCAQRSPWNAPGDTLTVIQKPLLNIPAINIPGETLIITCLAPQSTTGFNAWIRHGSKRIALPLQSADWQTNPNRWELQVIIPNVPVFELYDLEVNANGGIHDISENAVQVVPSRKQSYYFVHITDIHLPNDLYYPNAGYDTDSTSVNDFRAVIEDINLIHPEFVLLTGDLINEGELEGLAELSSRLGVARAVVSNVLPYTAEMNQEKLYGYEPIAPLKSGGWPVRSDAWMKWGITEMPRMHWGGEPHCRFIHDYAIVIGWDGGVSPCYALSHSYHYYTIDGIEKEVRRHTFGNVHQSSLADIWMSEEYTRYRSAVRAFHFPSCPDCDLRETCDLRLENNACWGPNPSCADCLWAQDIVRCP